MRPHGRSNDPGRRPRAGLRRRLCLYPGRTGWAARRDAGQRAAGTTCRWRRLPPFAVRDPIVGNITAMLRSYRTPILLLHW